MNSQYDDESDLSFHVEHAQDHEDTPDARVRLLTLNGFHVSTTKPSRSRLVAVLLIDHLIWQGARGDVRAVAARPGMRTWLRDAEEQSNQIFDELSHLQPNKYVLVCSCVSLLNSSYKYSLTNGSVFLLCLDVFPPPLQSRLVVFRASHRELACPPPLIRRR